MDEPVTVYTRPNCPQCVATKRKLIATGTPFVDVDVTQDDAARGLILSLGFQQAPVVNAGDSWWSGYRPDRIAALVRETVNA